MAFDEQLDIHLRARFTLILLVTPEEERAIETVKTLCDGRKRRLLSWDAGQGFQQVSGTGGIVPSGKDPLSALEAILKYEDEAVFILKDFHECWENARIKRMLRNVAQQMKFERKSLIVTAPSSKLPDELRDEAVILDFPPPNATELDAVLERLVSQPGIKMNLTKLGREKLIQASLGLTAAQAQRVFAKAIVADGSLDDRDIELVTREKQQIIRESAALEFYPLTETLADVGGLDVLKKWLGLRERAFTQEARDYGLPAPKGVALIGIPGTGKSLTAKMIGGLWRLPLLRLDVGSLFGSLVGQSEERARQALRLAETVAPCILWIDEIEKGLSSSQGSMDGGTSTRVFGTILTWMQEKTAPCFVVATANDISALPPELLRKGRFDEIFFLDLPTTDERREIFSVHLRKRKRMADDFDLDLLARESAGYVGAEIEQAIIDAMYIGFGEDREFTTEDIKKTLDRQVPLSVSQRETVGALRAWLKEGRAQSASFGEFAEAEQQFVPLEIYLN